MATTRYLPHFPPIILLKTARIFWGKCSIYFVEVPSEPSQKISAKGSIIGQGMELSWPLLKSDKKP